jgi:hypothetical protein
VVESELFEVVVVELESGCGRITAFRGGCGRARVHLWSNLRFVGACGRARVRLWSNFSFFR